MRQENKTAGRVGSARTEVRPTPIWISKRTRTVLLLGGLVALMLLMWLFPERTGLLLGGFSAVPIVAVLKVLFDFFRPRLRTRS